MPANNDEIEALFRVAAMDDDVVTLQAILKQYPDFGIDTSDLKLLRTALHWAIIAHSEHAISFLVEQGALVGLPDINGDSAYTLSCTHAMSPENKRRIWIEYIALKILDKTTDILIASIPSHTKRGDDNLLFFIKKMQLALDTCQKDFVKLNPIEVREKSREKQICLQKSGECIQKTWKEDVVPLLKAIHKLVNMLYSRKLEWSANELLLLLSKAQCVIPQCMVALENQIIEALSGFPEVKKEMLKKVKKIKHLLLKTVNSIQENFEKMGGGNYYIGFCNFAKNYAENGHDLTTLQMLSDHTSIKTVFESYNADAHLEWYKSLTVELKKQIEDAMLDVIFKKAPYSFTTEEYVILQESVFRVLLFLYDNLKLKIVQTNDDVLEGMYDANASLECIPTASYIFISSTRIQKAFEKAIEEILKNESEFLSLCTPAEPVKIILPLEVEDNAQESHKDVVQREKQWKKEQESEQRKEQQARTLLLQQQACVAILKEERKGASETRRIDLRKQLMCKMMHLSCADTFHAILNEKMNKKIKWVKLTALGESLGIARIEGLKCIFSLPELGAVTFHQGHGTDKSDWANPVGIDTLRTLFERLGFDKDSFLQGLRELETSAKNTPKVA